jgi:hypothetical protein
LFIQTFLSTLLILQQNQMFTSETAPASFYILPKKKAVAEGEAGGWKANLVRFAEKNFDLTVLL